jgi:hypothetical protein
VACLVDPSFFQILPLPPQKRRTVVQKLFLQC